MIPKSIDIHIICAKCQTPIIGAARQMVHDPAAGTYTYFLSCHGENETWSIASDGVDRAHCEAFPHRRLA